MRIRKGILLFAVLLPLSAVAVTTNSFVTEERGEGSVALINNGEIPRILVDAED